MIKLKQLVEQVINEKMLGYTLEDLIDKVLMFKDKTIIFFDTETTSLRHPEFWYNQLTEIGAVAIDGNTMEELGTFNYKVTLSPQHLRLIRDPESRERYSWEKYQELALAAFSLRPPKNDLDTYSTQFSNACKSTKTLFGLTDCLNAPIEVSLIASLIIKLSSNPKSSIRIVSSSVKLIAEFGEPFAASLKNITLCR